MIRQEKKFGAVWPLAIGDERTAYSASAEKTASPSTSTRSALHGDSKYHKIFHRFFVLRHGALLKRIIMKRYTILTALLCVAFYACSDDANKSSHHCGNGALDDQEQCDGTAFAEDLSITCPENMELSQSLVCSEECTVDLEKSCVPVGPKCGDGKLDDGEQCDKKQFRENV